jgi:two-component sensor histidine kinase
LQLVQALLTLQGSLSGDKVVENQLQMAATRMLTIGSVHRRLYEDNGAEETNAATYLRGLVSDLAAFCPDRTVTFQSPDITVSAARLAPLGLITAELLTNACKYGKGSIVVSLRQDEGAVLVTVQDEGDGFPETFPQPKGTGLGMRLVRSYSGLGDAAIDVDRSVPFSRITVRILT